MIGRTLGIYLALHFLRFTVYIYLLFFFLITAVDVIELSRSASQREGISTGDLLQISIMRVPELAQRVLPFAVLFGAATSLLILNKRLELVVARASGLSVWQFMLPFVATAVILGLFTSMIYQPLSLESRRVSQALEAEVFGRLKGKLANSSKNFWIRLAQEKGDVILRAKVAENNARKLAAVSVYEFDGRGASIRRLDAERAIFTTLQNGQNIYRLSNVTVTNPGMAGTEKKQHDVPVNITEGELLLNTTSPEGVGFWDLGTQAERMRTAGRNYLPFTTAFQAHLSRPLLFVAMALLAACISLRFARFGQSGKLVLGGVLAGFVLYVASELVTTFGSNGFVSPAMAAWSPALVATLIGTTVLLHQEDG